MIFEKYEIKQGEKKRISVPVTETVSLDVTCIRGCSGGKTLVLTAGVHGCEYVGAETLKRLAEALKPEELSGNVILLPVANPSGFFAGTKRTVPEDGVNLNRAFPGKKEGTLSARTAWVIEQELYPEADFLADLHSGDGDEALHPLVFFPAAGTDEVNQKSLAAAKVLSVPYRVRSASRNGLYSWAVQKGIPAVLMERGGRGLWSEEEVRDYERDVRALMRFLKILPDANKESEENKDQAEINRAVYEEARHTGFWYPNVKPGEGIRKGQVLGKLENSAGEILQEVRAEFDGAVLYYSVALGVKKGELLAAYGQPSCFFAEQD